MQIERYYNDKNELAVLVAKAPFWVDFNFETRKYPEAKFDKRLVELVLRDEIITSDMLAEFGYPDTHWNKNDLLMDISSFELEIIWVPKGRKFRIQGGGECNDWVEFLDETEWMEA